MHIEQMIIQALIIGVVLETINILRGIAIYFINRKRERKFYDDLIKEVKSMGNADIDIGANGDFTIKYPNEDIYGHQDELDIFRPVKSKDKKKTH